MRNRRRAATPVRCGTRMRASPRWGATSPTAPLRTLCRAPTEPQQRPPAAVDAQSPCTAAARRPRGGCVRQQHQRPARRGDATVKPIKEKRGCGRALPHQDELHRRREPAAQRRWPERAGGKERGPAGASSLRVLSAVAERCRRGSQQPGAGGAATQALRTAAFRAASAAQLLRERRIRCAQFFPERQGAGASACHHPPKLSGWRGRCREYTQDPVLSQHTPHARLKFATRAGPRSLPSGPSFGVIQVAAKYAQAGRGSRARRAASTRAWSWEPRCNETPLRRPPGESALHGPSDQFRHPREFAPRNICPMSASSGGHFGRRCTSRASRTCGRQRGFCTPM